MHWRLIHTVHAGKELLKNVPTTFADGVNLDGDLDNIAGLKDPCLTLALGMEVRRDKDGTFSEHPPGFPDPWSS